MAFIEKIRLPSIVVLVSSLLILSYAEKTESMSVSIGEIIDGIEKEPEVKLADRGIINVFFDDHDKKLAQLNEKKFNHLDSFDGSLEEESKYPHVRINNYGEVKIHVNVRDLQIYNDLRQTNDSWNVLKYLLAHGLVEKFEDWDGNTSSVVIVEEKTELVLRMELRGERYKQNVYKAFKTPLRTVTMANHELINIYLRFDDGAGARQILDLQDDDDDKPKVTLADRGMIKVFFESRQANGQNEQQYDAQIDGRGVSNWQEAKYQDIRINNYGEVRIHVIVKDPEIYKQLKATTDAWDVLKYLLGHGLAQIFEKWDGNTSSVVIVRERMEIDLEMVLDHQTELDLEKELDEGLYHPNEYVTFNRQLLTVTMANHEQIFIYLRLAN